MTADLFNIDRWDINRGTEAIKSIYYKIIPKNPLGFADYCLAAIFFKTKMYYIEYDIALSKATTILMEDILRAGSMEALMKYLDLPNMIHKQNAWQFPIFKYMEITSRLPNKFSLIYQKISEGYVYVDSYKMKNLLFMLLKEKLAEQISSIKNLDFLSNLTQLIPELDIQHKKKEFNETALPPCIKRIIGGVPSGQRNYAYVVVLAPFMSRIILNPKGKSPKISDYADMEKLKKEILPRIFCPPVLKWLEEEPNQIKSFYIALGFGSTNNPSISDSGKSTWLSCPSCSNIQANGLCPMDAPCRNKVKSPVSAYFKNLK